jgi:HEAT repeat protein
MGEPSVTYYALAAVCGLGGIDPGTWPAEDRKRILAGLLAILRSTNDVRARRASLVLPLFAREREVPQALALLEHPDETVRHNLRVWLFRRLRDGGVEAFTAALRDSGLRREVRRELRADFEEYVTDPEGSAFTGPLFAYIPNLGEVKPDTWKHLEPALAPPKAGMGASNREDTAEERGAQAPRDLLEQLADPAASVRRRAVKALGKERRESAIPALARALQDTDERLRGAAREALVRIGPTSFGALVDVLRCPEDASRGAALNALRRLAPAARKKVSKDLLAALATALKDESVLVRIAAAEVLGKLGANGRGALPALFEAARDTGCTAANVVVAESAITAALAIDPDCRQELVRAALPKLIEALKGKAAFAAAYAIARLGPDGREAVSALAEALADERRYSDNVVAALRDIGGEGIKPLADLVKNPRTPREQRKELFRKLGLATRADERLIALLADGLKDSDPSLRAAATQALGGIGVRAQAAVPALLGMLGDTEVDKAVTYETDLLAGTLARMRSAAVPGLIGVVQDEVRPPLARLQALRALGRMGRRASAAQPVLAVAMKDNNKALAVTAAGAYAQAGGEVAKALPILKDGLRDEAPSVLQAALFEVERLGPRARVLVPELLPLLKHRERAVCLSAARAVSMMGTVARQAVPALAELLKAGDGRDGFGDQVAEALKRLGPDAAEALPTLIEQLAHLEEMSPNPVLEVIGSIGPGAKPALPALLAILKDRKSLHHNQVIDVLGEIGPEAAPTLLAQLGDESEHTRASAARALGRIGPAARDAIPALKKRLSNEWNKVRVWAAFALIRITGDPNPYMPVLVELWNEGAGWAAYPYQWQLDVSEALVLLGAEAHPARKLLLDALADEDLQLGSRQRVTQALGQLRDDADVIVPRLIALTERPAPASGRPYQLKLALETLRLLGPKAKAALPRLRALAEDEDDEIAWAAGRALEAVGAN